MIEKLPIFGRLVSPFRKPINQVRFAVSFFLFWRVPWLHGCVSQVDLLNKED